MSKLSRLSSQLLVPIIALQLVSTSAYGQSYDPEGERTGFSTLTQSGKLVNLVVEPGPKMVRLQFVGKEAASAQIKDDGIVVSYESAGQRRELKLVKTIDPTSKRTVYTFERPNTPVENLEIKVKAGGKVDKFKLQKLD